jgi:peptide/nickel transport system permease protein
VTPGSILRTYMNYIIKRIFYSLFTIWLLSLVSFLIIQLPPGDYADTLMDALIQEGGDMNKEYVEAIRKTYGLDEPMIGRYFNWFLIFSGETGAIVLPHHLRLQR